MPKVFIEEATLTAIGNAIREKEGTSELVPVNDMATRISAIETGGGGAELPEEAFNYTGSLQYFNHLGKWDWFIENYGDKVTTSGVTILTSAFNSSDVKKIPFVININECQSFGSCFADCSELLESPKIRGTHKWSTSTSFEKLVNSCYKVKHLEDLFEPSMLDGFETVKVTSAASCPRPATFQSCYNLLEPPSWWYKQRVSPESTAYPSVAYSIYYYAFSGCEALRTAINIPVLKLNAALTSNNLDRTFANNYFISRITFETNSGQPIETRWKSQTLNLSDYIGYCKQLVPNCEVINSKQITDDTSYQALKDDPDRWTKLVGYSNYNHDSAVETINSLPDTSAYLASAGGTNTIKFKGTSGELTDGGAINTLTAEEIAVATAKGWTVTLV